MMRRAALAAFATVFGLGVALSAQAAEGEKPPAHDWAFDGVFGSFDHAALQRGFQVYKEICANCHGVRLLSFRNLRDIGLDEDAVKAIAANYQYKVEDGPNEEGEMFMRPAVPSDRIPSPFANEQAARTSNNGALPPDLSVIAKARKGGPDYLYALLTGFEDEPPEGVELREGMNYNRYFPGHQIAMPPQLFDEGVEFADGTEATAAQMGEDVAQFLAWAAEPNLVVRKRTGIKTILFLLVLTGLLYASKRKVWSKAH
jgi:cytochrome c1